MLNNELARAIAIGLIETGVEGGFDCVTCSTAGDYPSIGCSQWEGGRADMLLSYIDGGARFIGRSYSDIEMNDELEDLACLLDSSQGQEAQLMILSSDAEVYVETIQDEGVTNPLVIIYCGIWCPTSHYCVASFLNNMMNNGGDINDLEQVFNEFANYYADFADCSDYTQGYYNRACNTYEYVRQLNI